MRFSLLVSPRSCSGSSAQTATSHSTCASAGQAAARRSGPAGSIAKPLRISHCLRGRRFWLYAADGDSGSWTPGTTTHDAVRSAVVMRRLTSCCSRRRRSWRACPTPWWPRRATVGSCSSTRSPRSCSATPARNCSDSRCRRCGRSACASATPATSSSTSRPSIRCGSPPRCAGCAGTARSSSAR